MAVTLNFLESGAQSRERLNLEGHRHRVCDRRRDPIGRKFMMMQGASEAVRHFQAEHRPWPTMRRGMS